MAKKIKFFKPNTYKKIFAFSLIEILVTMITLSCFAAVFVPVFTKKQAKKRAMMTSTHDNVSSDCSQFGDDCTLCYKDKCISCELFCGNENEYLEDSECACKKCLEKFENCATCDKEKCKSCESGYTLTDKKCIPNS